mmetsp:Transcript_11856/g.29950  ORF Transcript_11856/g.29950 Transcript_11856/m.29950 type:complete len:104 (-) Transcript_11856:926-1237(-)
MSSLLFFLAICAFTSSSSVPPSTDHFILEDGGSDLHFLMYGDWGEPVHSKNAKSMADFAHSQKSDFMLALGDNFYDDGVESTKDKKWKNIFEDIYTQDSLQFP